MNDPILEKIKNNWKLVILAGLVVGVLFFSVSAFIPPKYKAETSLAISHEDQSNLDAYRDAKSSEFSARIVHEVILSNYFIALVFDERDDLKDQFFKSEKYQSEQLKIWKKRIKVSQVPNTGLLSISVYSESKNQSHEIATIISNLLKARSGELIGKKGIIVKQINSPYVINDPAFPNVWLNAFLGVFLGIIIFVAVAYVTKGESIEKFNLIFTKKKNLVADYDLEKNDYSASKIKDSIRKELDHATTYFDDYVFNSQKKDLAKTKDEGKEVVTSEKLEAEKEEIKEKEIKVKDDKKTKSITKNKTKKVVEIKEPNSLDDDFSFEDALVDNNIPSSIDSKEEKGTPGNLPTLEGGMESLLGKQEVQSETSDAEDLSNQQKESTEDEVKEKLNKLLRGELE